VRIQPVSADRACWSGGESGNDDRYGGAVCFRALVRCPATLLGVRRLIVNADDLGLTEGVNRAILEAHQNGVVLSATLMANGGAFEHAVELARSAPGLSVGCHVVLVDGAPVIRGEAGSSLLSKRSGSAQFPQLSTLAMRAVLGKLDREQMVSEIVGQVRKIRAAGIQVTHFDTHKHTHIFPSVLDALVGAALICGVPAIRNPVVPEHPMEMRELARRPALWKRYGQVKVLRQFGRRFRERVKRAGLATPDGVIGVVETGSFNHALLEQAIENLPEGTWELVCHPGYDDDALRSAGTRLTESRDEERRLLSAPELRGRLEAHGIRVISYREFAGS